MPSVIKAISVLLLISGSGFFVIPATYAQGVSSTKAKTAQQSGKSASLLSSKREVIIITPPNHVPKPGSPEEAFLKQQVKLTEQGKVQGVRFGSTEPPPAPLATGTYVSLGAMEGRTPTVVDNEFAKVMKAKDPIPPSRVAHFLWLSKVPEAKQTGWSGTIMTSQARGNNTWLVKVRISPHVYTLKRVRWVVDFVDEVYLFDGQNLQLMETDALIPKPEMQRFHFR